MTTNNNSAWIKVFSGAAFETEVVKGLLDANSIECAVIDATIGAVTSSYSPTAGDAVVVVDEKDCVRALEIIGQGG